MGRFVYETAEKQGISEKVLEDKLVELLRKLPLVLMASSPVSYFTCPENLREKEIQELTNAIGCTYTELSEVRKRSWKQLDKKLTRRGHSGHGEFIKAWMGLK